MNVLKDILKTKRYLLELELISKGNKNQKLTVHWNSNKVEIDNNEIRSIIDEFDKKHINILNLN